MARKTKQNKITSPELVEQINPDNKRLVADYLSYLRSVQRSEGTIDGYRNDLEIFFVFCLQKLNNKFFVDITKRDIVAYQQWLLYNNSNSPSRVRRLKACLSSLSNFIENICDDEYPNFRNIINKVENPVNEPVREKTVFSEEQLKYLLDYLVEHNEPQKACAVALAMYSGARKSELARFKVDFFNDENIIYSSLYKTSEKIKTKGRGNGKYIYKYVLAKQFKPYLDIWLAKRRELGINSEWLLVNKSGEQIKVSTLDSWADGFTKILGVDFYWHANRHFWTTALQMAGLPDSVIQEISGWTSINMVQTYSDLNIDDRLADYFDENGIKSVKSTSLAEL